MFKLIGNIVEFDGYEVGCLYFSGIPASVQDRVYETLERVNENALDEYDRGYDDAKDEYESNGVEEFDNGYREGYDECRRDITKIITSYLDSNDLNNDEKCSNILDELLKDVENL